MVEMFLEFAKMWGLPFALLLLLAWERFHTVKKKDAQITAMSIAHAKALTALAKEKDEELKRINEARIAEQSASKDSAIKVATEFTKMAGELNTTSELLVDKFGGLTQAVERLERAAR